MKIDRWLLGDTQAGTLRDVGLLGMRLATGLTMALAHGWGKFTGFSERAARFPDPLGVGSELSMALAVFGEFFCGLALAAGLLTRAALVPFAITMGVAFFVHHAGDPFGDREKALLFLVPALALLLTGPGRFSLDAVIFRNRNRED